LLVFCIEIIWDYLRDRALYIAQRLFDYLE
jgi:hypothetical protein